MLDSLGEGKTVNINVKDGGLLIAPLTVYKARINWERQFSEAIAKGYTIEEESIHIENDFDKEEWTW